MSHSAYATSKDLKEARGFLGRKNSMHTVLCRPMHTHLYTSTHISCAPQMLGDGKDTQGGRSKINKGWVTWPKAEPEPVGPDRLCLVFFVFSGL